MFNVYFLAIKGEKKYMLNVKTYALDSQYLDVVATWKKEEVEVVPDNMKSLGNNDFRKDESLWSVLTQEDKDRFNKERSIQRTKTKVRRLVISQKMKYMWTLTFAKKEMPVNGVMKDYGDLDDVWSAWRAFIKRCNRIGLKFKYIVTVELHEKRLEKYNEKVYHFHFATDQNIPINAKHQKQQKKEFNMLSLWGHGFVFVSASKKKGKFAHMYLMKYISKMFDETEKGSNRYRCSKGMVVPVTKQNFDNELMLDMYVNALAATRNCEWKKDYYALNDGDVEILVYILTPKPFFKEKIIRKNILNKTNSGGFLNECN